MSKIYREGTQIYPETTPSMVIDPETGKDILNIIADEKDGVISLVRGLTEGMDPKTYPFRDLGTAATSDALQDMLDSLHGTASDNVCGWFRVNMRGIYFQVLNFATSYANDEYAQLLLGPFSVSESTGKVVAGPTFNAATRRHVGGDSPRWTAWEGLAAGGSTGTAGMSTALQFPTRDGNNMDKCLESGVYAWCDLGRPAGSTGHFTLFVKKSATADFNDYYTIEQTAYGREGDELGQIWKRIIFQKSGDTGYHDWVRVDESTEIVQQTGQSVTSVMSQKAVTNAIANANEFVTGVFPAGVIGTTDYPKPSTVFAGTTPSKFITDVIDLNKPVLVYIEDKRQWSIVKVSITINTGMVHKYAISFEMPYIEGNTVYTISWGFVIDDDKGNTSWSTSVAGSLKPTSNIEDSLTSTSAVKALSANQGRALDRKIEALNAGSGSINVMLFPLAETTSTISASDAGRVGLTPDLWTKIMNGKVTYMPLEKTDTESGTATYMGSVRVTADAQKSRAMFSFTAAIDDSGNESVAKLVLEPEGTSYRVVYNNINEFH